jgi:alpha-D-ribose 1-methylphosphonate 5-triphosphate synthase subunit PhnG
MPPDQKAAPSDLAVPQPGPDGDGRDPDPRDPDARDLDPAAALPSARRAELLAVAEESELVALADRCLEAAPGTRVTEPPTVGTIPLCVREPVVSERFILADVLATQAGVEHRGQRGWAMRLGDDAVATLAAAICDAEAASGTGLAREVDLLCRRTERRRAEEAAREWAELARTEVHFQELT